MGTINGTSGADNLLGSPTRPADGSLTILIGGAGNDTITGYLGYWNVVDYGTSPTGIFSNFVTGTVLDGFGSTDTLINVLAIRGSQYNDTLIGTYGHNWSVLEGMAGNDVINGLGNVANNVNYSQSPGGVVVNLATGTASDGWGSTDTLLKVVNLTGSNYEDALTGAATNDWFSASYGSDTINGADGLNTLDYTPLTGGLASGLAVTLTGNNAGTVAKRPWGATTDSVDVFSNIQILKLMSGADRLTGWADATQDTWLRPQAGNDTIIGAQNPHNIADYTDSPAAVVIKLEVSTHGGDWFGTAVDGFQIPGQPAGTYYVDFLADVAGVYGSGFADSISGSSHDDVIKGGWGNDTIDGGSGSDTALFDGRRGDANWWRNDDGSWSVLSGVNLDRLYNVENLAFDDGLARLPSAAVARDFTGSGTSDILFRNAGGGLVQWQINKLALGGGGGIYDPVPDWTIAGIADMDGDLRADIVWRHTDGTLALWKMNGLTLLGGGNFGQVDAAWSVAALADFNGDGKADILWRNTDGTLAQWWMDGETLLPGGGNFATVDAALKIAAAADFNGDGKADILWRNTDGTPVIWLMDGVTLLGTDSLHNPGTDWSIAGTGDFNGDGKADILWRNTDGRLVQWWMDGETLLPGGGNFGTMDAAWKVANISDFNADSRADILWRNDNGSLLIWEMDGLRAIATGDLGNPGAVWSVV